MAEIKENSAFKGNVELEESVEEITSPDLEKDAETAPDEEFQGIDLIQLETPEETDSKPILELGDNLLDEQTACPPTDDISTSESKWVVGAPCRAMWSEDGLVYPAKVVAVDGERCRVCFHGYGNEEDMELSALQSPSASPQTQNSQLQDWKPGSRCRAVYSEDGLVYPAVVLWVDDQRCCVRYDIYDNEEEHDVSSLLNPDELHGPSRGVAFKGSSWKLQSRNFDWKRTRREDNQGERGGERRWREDLQNSSTVKEKLGNQRQAEKEADEKKRGNQQGEEAEKPTNHSFPLFPPYPPPQMGAGNPMSFPSPPPPPPVWILCGKEAGGSPDVNTITNMLMQWYMCGFHTGTYMAQQLFKSTLKDEVKSER